MSIYCLNCTVNVSRGFGARISVWRTVYLRRFTGCL